VELIAHSVKVDTILQAEGCVQSRLIFANQQAHKQAVAIHASITIQFINSNAFLKYRTAKYMAQI
jgi:hypothetical protein